MKLLIIGDGFLGKSLYDYFKINSNMDIDIVNRHTPTAPYDIVINTAGLIKSNSHLELVRNNIDAPLYYLMEYHLLNPKVKFIHMGSSSEYGKIKTPFKESMTCVPDTNYGFTKNMGVVALQRYAELHSIDLNIVRPFSIYGIHDKPDKFIPVVLDSIRKGVPIKVYPGAHDWLYIEDFCSLCLSICLKDLWGFTINACSNSQHSNEDVVDTILSLMNKHTYEVVYHNASLYAYDKLEWYGSNDLAVKIWEWTPKFTLRRGLNDLINKTAITA